MKSNKELFETTDKLHVLLGIAIQDLQTCTDNGIDIAMDTWAKSEHNGESERICTVCLAGAVMVNKYSFMPDGACHYLPFAGNLNKRFKTLDCLRTGKLGKAYFEFYGVCAVFEDDFNIRVAEIETSPHVWLTVLNRLHEYLVNLDI